MPHFIRSLALALLLLAPGAHAARLEWNPNPEKDIKEYRIYTSPDGVTYTFLKATSETTLPIPELPAYYRATAVNTSGAESAPSEPMGYKVPPTTPGDARSVETPTPSPTAAPEHDMSYLLNEDFETTPTGWKKNITLGGTISFTFTPALVGTQSICIAGAFASTTKDLSPATSELWVFGHHLTTSGRSGVYITNASGTIIAGYQVRASSLNKLSIFHGSTGTNISVPTPTAESVFWMRYVKGTGSNGVLEFYWNNSSSSETRPTLLGSITTGTATADAGKLMLVTEDTHADQVFDKLRASTSEIGDGGAVLGGGRPTTTKKAGSSRR